MFIWFPSRLQFFKSTFKMSDFKRIGQTNHEDMNTQSIPITIKALATVLN